jgi:hypothetical protein
MTNKNLSERFAESKGLPILHEGAEVHAIFRRELTGPASIKLWFRSVPKRAPQGLCFSLDSGELVLDGEKTKLKMRVWQDMAPPEIQIECLPKGKRATLRIWNIWRNANDVTDAWIGNAGMIIESNDVIHLRCSDGVGAPSFDDLVADLLIVPVVAPVESSRTGRSRKGNGFRQTD